MRVLNGSTKPIFHTLFFDITKNTNSQYLRVYSWATIERAFCLNIFLIDNITISVTLSGRRVFKSSSMLFYIAYSVDLTVESIYLLFVFIETKTSII